MTYYIIIFSYAAQAVIGIAALFGNILVISCFLRFSKLRTITNKYILNLSIACLCGSTTSVINSIHSLFYNHAWQFSEILCKLYLATLFLHSHAICFFLVILCVDRYLAIVRPASRTRVNSNIMMTAAWIASALLSIPTFMYTKLEGGYCDQYWESHEDLSGHYIAAVYVFTLILVPLILVITFNILFGRKLNIFRNCNRSSEIVVEFNRSDADGDDVNSSANVVDQSNMAVQVDREVNNATRKVSIHVIIVTAIWTLSTIPFVVFHIITLFHRNIDAKSITVKMLYVSKVIQTLCELFLPVLYALLNDNYRKCIVKLFTCAAAEDVNATLREESTVPRSGVDVTTLLQPSVLPYRVLE